MQDILVNTFIELTDGIAIQYPNTHKAKSLFNKGCSNQRLRIEPEILCRGISLSVSFAAIPG